MEKKKYELCFEVLRRMADARILDKLVIVGSWCLLFYEDYFAKVDYHAALRTRDIDFAITIPFHMPKSIDLHDLLKDLGFIMVHKDRIGHITLQHPELILEFLAPMRGRANDKPYNVPQLGINAERLRFLDFLQQGAIQAKTSNVIITIPHPIKFAIHKLIIAPRRKNIIKKERDVSQATKVLTALIAAGESGAIKDQLRSIPKKWRSSAKQQLIESGDKSIITLFF